MALLALLPHNNLFHIVLIIKPLGLKLVWFDKFFKGLKSVVDKPSIAKRLQGKHSHINIAAYNLTSEKFPQICFHFYFVSYQIDGSSRLIEQNFRDMTSRQHAVRWDLRDNHT